MKTELKGWLADNTVTTDNKEDKILVLESAGNLTLSDVLDEMKKEDTEMMLRIFETERAGYAYLYPSDGGERKEDYISTTAENIANYIGSHMFEAEKIVITDMCDRLILDTCGYFINSCPNQEFCKEIHPFLIPIQMGEKDAGEVLSVSRDVAEQYFREEDEAATMAEIGMM